MSKRHGAIMASADDRRQRPRIALRLPSYWFADPQMRSNYRIPHYLMGGLVRYRPSNCRCGWAARSIRAQGVLRMRIPVRRSNVPRLQRHRANP